MFRFPNCIENTHKESGDMALKGALQKVLNPKDHATVESAQAVTSRQPSESQEEGMSGDERAQAACMNSNSTKAKRNASAACVENGLSTSSQISTKLPSTAAKTSNPSVSPTNAPAAEAKAPGVRPVFGPAPPPDFERVNVCGGYVDLKNNVKLKNVVVDRKRRRMTQIVPELVGGSSVGHKYTARPSSNPFSHIAKLPTAASTASLKSYMGLSNKTTKRKPVPKTDSAKPIPEIEGDKAKLSPQVADSSKSADVDFLEENWELVELVDDMEESVLLTKCE